MSVKVPHVMNAVRSLPHLLTNSLGIVGRINSGGGTASNFGNRPSNVTGLSA